MGKEELYSTTKQNYLIETGIIDDYQYAIRTTGDHPCAYVGKKDLFAEYDPDELEDNLDVHGGITFKSCSWHLSDLDSSFDWIGWDYAHCGDYCTWMDREPNNVSKLLEDSHKYTYEEILEDIKSAINELKNFKEGNNAQ